MTDQGGTSPVASCLETTACQPLYYQASTAKDAEHAARPDVTLPHLRSVHYKVTTATTSGPGIRNAISTGNFPLSCMPADQVLNSFFNISAPKPFLYWFINIQ